MGIDIDSKFLVGRYYSDDEFTEWLDTLDSDLACIDDILYDFNLESASPYYDSSREECFYGISVENNLSVEDTFTVLIKANQEFRNITGLEGVVYAGKHVW